MTAEVIVLNKSAVALAADSAATIGDEADGKIWNSVNKLFTLSKYHPVGVLIYSNADYMGVPFETIIKMYREQLGKTKEPTVEAYAAKFAKYLGTGLFASAAQQEANTRRLWQVVFDELIGDIRDDVQAEFRKHGDCPPERRKEIFDKRAGEHLAALEECAIAEGFAKVDPIGVVKQYSKQYEAVIKSVFSASQKLIDPELFKRIAGLAVTKNHDYPTYTGVVVAGFGEKEIFPQYVMTRVHGIYADTLKSIVGDKDGIAGTSHSLIVPFAQTEMVGRFMEGVDQSYENYVRGSTVEALRELANGIINVHVAGSDDEKKKIREEVEKALSKQAAELGENARVWRQKKFVNQVLEVVVSLPKEELANLAEALVNLTSIKRRMSSERETVGGPVDVAVISKGDGFIWIKRKHYFAKELNPQFFANYWRSP